ncbi:hypothetical protein IIA15_01140 [candidate division TA06 bacterium]|nr:hypothetical protein [candidate division TA06 bacterium]
MIKRFTILMLPAFLFAFISCSDNPSEPTSGVTNLTQQATPSEGDDEADLQALLEEVEDMAIEALYNEDPSLRDEADETRTLHRHHRHHRHHISTQVGILRTNCGQEGNVVWGQPTNHRVAFAFTNLGHCDAQAHIDGQTLPIPSNRHVVHGSHPEANRASISCLGEEGRCKIVYAFAWRT